MKVIAAGRGLADISLNLKDPQMGNAAGQRNMTLLRPVQKDVKIFQIAEHFTTMVQGKQLIRTVTFKRGESLVLNFQMERKDLQVYVKRKVGFSMSLENVFSQFLISHASIYYVTFFFGLNCQNPNLTTT